MWDKLSLKEKAAFVKVAAKNGLYDRLSIIKSYNRHAEGGYLDWILKVKLWRPGIEADIDAENPTYDYEGFFNDNPNYAWSMLNGNKEAHFTDKFKKPNHPTFSDESIYSNSETPGGRWHENYGNKRGWVYEPSEYMRLRKEDTLDYLAGSGEGYLDGMNVVYRGMPTEYNKNTNTRKYGGRVNKYDGNSPYKLGSNRLNWFTEGDTPIYAADPVFSKFEKGDLFRGIVAPWNKELGLSTNELLITTDEPLLYRGRYTGDRNSYTRKFSADTEYIPKGFKEVDIDTYEALLNDLHKSYDVFSDEFLEAVDNLLIRGNKYYVKDSSTPKKHGGKINKFEGGGWSDFVDGLGGAWENAKLMWADLISSLVGETRRTLQLQHPKVVDEVLKGGNIAGAIISAPFLAYMGLQALPYLAPAANYLALTVNNVARYVSPSIYVLNIASALGASSEVAANLGAASNVLYYGYEPAKQTAALIDNAVSGNKVLWLDVADAALGLVETGINAKTGTALGSNLNPSMSLTEGLLGSGIDIWLGYRNDDYGSFGTGIIGLPGAFGRPNIPILQNADTYLDALDRVPFIYDSYQSLENIIE